MHLFYINIMKEILTGESQDFGVLKKNQAKASVKRWYEIRSQLQEENWKTHKYVKIKQFALEQTMGQRKKQKKNQTIS